MANSGEDGNKKARRFDSDGSPIVPILRKDNPDARGLISGDHDIYPRRHKFSPNAKTGRSPAESRATSASSGSRTVTPSIDSRANVRGSPSESRYSSSPEKIEPGEDAEAAAGSSSNEKPLTPEQQHQIITRYYYTKTTNWSKYKSEAGDREKKQTMEEIEARAQFQESTAAHLMELANTMAEANQDTKQAMEELLGEGMQALGVSSRGEEEGEGEEGD